MDDDFEALSWVDSVDAKTLDFDHPIVCRLWDLEKRGMVTKKSVGDEWDWSITDAGRAALAAVITRPR